MKKISLYLMLILLAACSSSADKFDDLKTVNHLNLKQYSGDWYEVARIDHWFQKGCYASTANYQIKKDGDIQVTNRCRLNLGKGEIKESVGRAWPVKANDNSKLKVQFAFSGRRIPLFAGDYWVIDLDKNYRYAMIGEKKREYLWILSRSKTLPKKVMNRLINKAKKLGFPTEKLVFQGS